MLNELPLRNTIEHPNIQQQCSEFNQHPSTSRLVVQPNDVPPALPGTLEEDLYVSSSSSDLYEPSSDIEIESSLESDVEDFPDREKVSTKKKRNEKLWKKNVRKVKRLKGESYIGHRGIEKPSRPLLPAPCLNKPKHKCATSVTEPNRIRIYNDFRNLSCIDDQRQFLYNHIEKKPKKRTTRGIENSRKNYTCLYSLTVDGKKLTVCREFFMATLNVTDAFMRSAANKHSSNGALEQDKRGKHQPSNKLPQNVETFIRNQILSFPAVESHYCRQSSKKKYLDPCLNISIMYRMYKELCHTENVKIVTFEKYRQIFSEYNLGFFKPKKDQCKKCLAYTSMSEEEKKAEEGTYQKHLNRKNEARQARDEDKLIAKENPKVLAFNFDLQAVLTTPKGSAGQIFYLRKLAVFNFTIYNLGNQNVMCYLWDETKGKRGSNEISSCVNDYIMSHSEIEAVRMMSDGCGGQQKNSIFAAMCIQLLAEHPSLKVIDHRFFETGHTEMECDSIHSKIEKKAKYVPVYTPEGWAQLIRDARIIPCPFTVKSLTFDDFLDFKGFSNNMNSFNFNNIPWKKLCCLRYIKENNCIKVFYKIEFTDDFIGVDCKKTRGRQKQAQLKKAYQNDLPISQAKWKDLDKMCQDLTIPKAYHDFYRSLKTNHNVRDNLPEPDIGEDSDTDED